MYIEEFDYTLPKELVAQHPTVERASSRLLVFDRLRSSITHRSFTDIPGFLRKGDVLVVNDSKVFPAKLTGRKDTGGKVELLLTEKMAPDRWVCLTRDVRKGTGEVNLTIGEYRAVLAYDGSVWTIRFLYDGDSEDIIERYGKMPLPPYIKRNNGDGFMDYERYQTVYAARTGSIAAPTAGFHFSESLIGAIEAIGVKVVRITLHIGIGTFSLVKSPSVEEHAMHREYYELGDEAKQTIEAAREAGGRIVACGTSAVRTLETIFSKTKESPLRGYTQLFIYPGYAFNVVDALITNFHLPRSTPLLLASAFAGKEGLMKCYGEAIQQGYRFYSYGDAMLIQ